MAPSPVQLPNLFVPLKMKLKISQQQVLATVLLVYTLQTNSTLTHLNEIILKMPYFWQNQFYRSGTVGTRDYIGSKNGFLVYW